MPVQMRLGAVPGGIVGMLMVLVLLLTVAPSWALLGAAFSEIVVLVGSWAIVWPRQRAAERRAAVA